MNVLFESVIAQHGISHGQLKRILFAKTYEYDMWLMAPTKHLPSPISALLYVLKHAPTPYVFKALEGVILEDALSVFLIHITPKHRHVILGVTIFEWVRYQKEGFPPHIVTLMALITYVPQLSSQFLKTAAARKVVMDTAVLYHLSNKFNSEEELVHLTEAGYPKGITPSMALLKVSAKVWDEWISSTVNITPPMLCEALYLLSMEYKTVEHTIVENSIVQKPPHFANYNTH